VSAFSDATQIQLLEAIAFSGPIPRDLADVQDNRQELLAGIALGVGLAALCFTLIWVYRANKNARALGTDMKYSPGWSVGWFFVPIAGLYVPYFVIKEIWQGSMPIPAGQSRPAAVSPILKTWWIAGVTSAVIQYSRLNVLVGRWRLAWVLDFGTELDSRRYVALTYREFFIGRLISDVVEIAVCILTIVVIVSITNLQEQRAAESGALMDK
jgi:hypothetical protein